MKKLAMFFNTCELGGAERSIIEQMCLIRDEYNITFYIPYNSVLKNSIEIVNLINSRGDYKIEYFYYPNFLYSFSRSSSKLNIIKIAIFFPFIIFSFFRLVKLRSYEYLYANGAKAAVYLMIFCNFILYKGIFVWHFRDYPPKGFLNRVVNILLSLKRLYKIFLTGNSISVKNEIKNSIFRADYYGKIYNPVGDNIQIKTYIPDDIKKIGIVSMFAPWKGIQNIIKFAADYSSQLKEIGIEEIAIYGGDIYKTDGLHQNHGEELKMLKSILKADLITFKGLLPPQDIYKNIDLLIHPSLEPEPFGRVIVEAFRSQIPVISTGLGGASELVIHDKTGWIFDINDQNMLFFLINKIVCADKSCREIVKNAFEFEKNISGSIKKELKLFLEGKDFERETEKTKDSNDRSRSGR